MIREISFSAFRGIVHPLTISLEKNGKPRSLGIFGRNGFGKSSITDAWEWFHTGTIQHLAREGAMASSYPSRGTDPKNSYVEVVFSDPVGGKVRLALNSSRSINVQGHRWFKEKAKHPCHIRFEDLTHFVFLTKTERFDELAGLMGFAPQVELLRQLRRVEGKLADQLNKVERTHETNQSAVVSHFKLSNDEGIGPDQVLSRYTTLFSRHNIPVTTWDAIQPSIKQLSEAVERDTVALELKDLTSFVKCIERIESPSSLLAALQDYASSVKEFKSKERDAVDSVLMNLYQQGESILVSQRAAAISEDTCPLCGQVYEGDLLIHVRNELNALKELRAAHDLTEEARRNTTNKLFEKDQFTAAFNRGLADCGNSATQFTTSGFAAANKQCDSIVSDVRSLVEVQISKVSKETLIRLAESEPLLRSTTEVFEAAKKELLHALQSRLTVLGENNGRKLLVEDHQKALKGIDLWNAFVQSGRDVNALKHCCGQFHSLVEDYVRMNIEDVDGRFAAISSDVDKYFSILEASTEGIAHPALKLLRDQDRAVVLEIEFRGEVISPAYSYLSESQLNSFGLAVFLASARLINKDFKLLILDDVVSSFDAYKRPALIRLLKQEFSDFQVIVFTHDDVWWTQLGDQCAAWQRLKIRNYTPGVGPNMDTSNSDIEVVQNFLAMDEAVLAARTLGPTLERKLQEICEAFRAKVEYNSRNEYTLRPLVQSLLSTVSKRLGSSHSLTVEIRAFDQNTAFRNFASHWKNPASNLTSTEINGVVNQWLKIEQMLRCANDQCGDVAVWQDDKDWFSCSCATVVLVKQ